MEIRCNSSSFYDKLQHVPLAVSSLFWPCQLCDLSWIVHSWWWWWWRWSVFLLWVLFKCICCCVNFRRWEGSSLVFVRWVRGGASMNSIVWRRGCCRPFLNRCRPFRKHSRNWQIQSEKRVSHWCSCAAPLAKRCCCCCSEHFRQNAPGIGKFSQ